MVETEHAEVNSWKLTCTSKLWKLMEAVYLSVSHQDACKPNSSKWKLIHTLTFKQCSPKELQMTFCLAGAWMFKKAWLAQKAVLLHSQEYSHSTGGCSQPWVVSSPISKLGSFQLSAKTFNCSNCFPISSRRKRINWITKVCISLRRPISAMLYWIFLISCSTSDWTVEPGPPKGATSSMWLLARS